MRIVFMLMLVISMYVIVIKIKKEETHSIKECDSKINKSSGSSSFYNGEDELRIPHEEYSNPKQNGIHQDSLIKEMPLHVVWGGKPFSLKIRKLTKKL